NFYFNKSLINTYDILCGSFGLKLYVKKENNVLRLNSTDGCDDYNNVTCLSFCISELSVFASEELAKISPIFFGES
ncbi:MAG: hypothetical protein QXE15_06740, partial [Candidatus Bathyarchaeia archaeon]